MEERLRQRYLKQMGFTPWVAAVPLPGAAPSPLLDIEPLPELNALPDIKPESPGVQQGMPEQVAALLKADEKPRLAAPPVQSSDKTAPAVSEPVAAPSLTFTLQAHRGAQIHLWAEQQQADAPGLNREELQQLAALLKLFGGTVSSDAKRFFCAPTAGKPMTAENVRPMFDAFLSGMLGRQGEIKLLLCAREETVQALFNSPRYQPVVRGQITLLPVSSLTEMLADPAAHKVPSWKAMQTHGFV
ncbi:hypothetical protein [Alcanivorax sp. 1008]|uniref:hypothetical protein n=1 Tax=Alcanivorax sp. 1008 TaxID=2816853 RepID=UPI001D4E85FE|nr:hypothetical protein [Alcanivorax sp. 1008]MCC1495316.1 hypothetical protein [Alcanivorax sp. 1008]